MPKKKAKEPEPEPEAEDDELEPKVIVGFVEDGPYVDGVGNEENWLESFRGQEQNAECMADCDEMVGQIVGAYEAVIKEKVRKEATFGVAVSRALSDSAAVISQRFTHPDQGSSKAEQDSEIWICEEEPSPSVLDTWARGSVPVKIRPKIKVEEIDEDGDLPGGMSTARSMRSTRSVGSRKSRSRASSAATEGEPKMIVAHSKPVPPKPHNRQDEIARAAMKERVDKEKRVAAIEAAYNDERGKIAEVLQELKGTEYGYNHKGEIIMLESVNTERLPSQDVHLRVGLWSEADEETEDPLKAKKAARGKKGRKVQPSASPTKSVGSIVSAGAMQGSSVETIIMESGVVLRSGETEKKGPPSKRDPMRMSRKDYAKLLSGSGTFPEPMAETAKTWGTEGLSGDEEEEEEEEEEADWMADARPATPPEQEEEELPPALANHMEFNQSIVGSADWGQVGAPAVYRPVQPPGKELLEVQHTAAIGHRTRIPRERPYDKVPGIPTSDRTKLPAPVFPAAKGHGFQLGYLGGEKSFVEASQAASFVQPEEGDQSAERLPPINGSRSFSSNPNVSVKKRSFNRMPPSHINVGNAAAARKIAGVR
eukprot:COSAG05_NODE_19_length_34900_cov_72.237464_15_plen_596_part_00